jgi:peptidoglycan/xylan/chitin deacetylase (PgdA/CDA1 family)
MFLTPIKRLAALPPEGCGGCSTPVNRGQSGMNIRDTVKEVAAVLACAVGAPALLRRARKGGLAILMFHGIEPEPVSPPCWHVLDVPTFRRQMRYLKRYFTVLPLEEALERLYAGTLPERAVTLTFDDGTQNLLTHAAPVLREFGFTAAVFLATGPMGTDELLWPDRLWLSFARTNEPAVDLHMLDLGLRSLQNPADRGEAYALAVEKLKNYPDSERLALLETVIAELGAPADGDTGPFRLLSWDEARTLKLHSSVALYPHTVTHPILSRCPDGKVEREIIDSCDAVERHTASDPKVFAYPNGRAQDFDGRAKDALSRRGLRWALATTSGVANRGSDPFALPRIGIGCSLSFSAFRLLVSGAAP